METDVGTRVDVVDGVEVVFCAPSRFVTPDAMVLEAVFHAVP